MIGPTELKIKWSRPVGVSGTSSRSSVSVPAKHAVPEAAQRVREVKS